MNKKILKVIKLLEEIKRERAEVFFECNFEELEKGAEITSEDVELIEEVIEMLQNLL